MQKKVTEKYVVDAVSHTEAEEKIIEEMSAYISGEFDVKGIVPASYSEIFFNDAADADRYFKAKLQFITIDEHTGKEKRSNVYYLVHAATFDGAVKAIHEVLGSTMIDYVIASLAETPLLAVFAHHADKQDSDGKDGQEK